MKTVVDAIVDSFASALSAAIPGTSLDLPLLPAPAEVLLCLAEAERSGRPAILVTDGTGTLETRHQDARTLAAGRGIPVHYFPPADPAASSSDLRGSENTAMRMKLLMALAGHAGPTHPEGPFLLVTCVQAILGPLPPPSVVDHDSLVVKLQDEADILVLERRLLHTGYVPVPQVQDRGEISRRGCLLDVWPVNETWPFRIECDDPFVVSIRQFDPLTQRSIARPSSLQIGPVQPLLQTAAATACIADYLPPGCVYLWSDMDSIREQVTAVDEPGDELTAPNDNREDQLALLQSRPGTTHLRTTLEPGGTQLPAVSSVLPSTSFVQPLKRGAWSPDELKSMCSELSDRLSAGASSGTRAAICFSSAGLRDHFVSEFGARLAGVETGVGELSEGLVCPAAHAILLSESDIYGRRDYSGRHYDPLSGEPRPSPQSGDRLMELSGIEVGDLVVHTDHGIGRYLGLSTITVAGQEQEVVTIEYADEARLHVPVAHAHLLTRYLGAGGRTPELHKLGGKRWTTEKRDAASGVADLAASLLETHAHRELMQGYAFSRDVPWQREFEAAFPYRETRDQERVIAEVKQDMEAARPMDRLICGDAGYGKTEIAMRSAFKAALDGRQVAVLVPTTVLAQQHFNTFRERMAAYPFRIEMLSRFVSPSQREAAIRGMADGSVDIVIGTHALLGPDIAFHNLGLVIIDEEQRFGVAHKERLKQMRKLVDVLTLTATPIPRTLHFSLTGARDMSLLQTPPFERQSIDTIVTRATDDVIRKAILRELSREGQVYYLHNRVMTIDKVRERLCRLVPEARIEVGHGQMSAGDLQDVMRRFVEREFDVLLCTTIIESGVDISTANTILIDRADRFGIADLYQLRGRVGRSSRHAYAYFLLPPHGSIDSDARHRLAAVRRHTGAGSGFNLAMRDLEIRGAGNLLGRQQSGHIAAVGFGLYCQLLKRTVATLRGEAPPPVIETHLEIDFLNLSPRMATDPGATCVPHEYIEDASARMELHRKLAQITSTREAEALKAELEDRYGPLPAPVLRLLRVLEIRIAAHQAGIRSVQVRDGKLILANRAGPIMDGGRFPRLREGSPDEQLSQIRQAIAAIAGNKSSG